jgi:diguanylate cyclase (GGDEF)-like protein
MKFGIAARLSWVLAFCFSVIAGLTSWYAYSTSRDLLTQSAKHELLASANLIVRRVLNVTQETSRDLQLLARHPASHAVLEQQGAAAQMDQLATLFALLMDAQPSYFQIRLISASDHGLERVRIDRDGSRLVRVTGDYLQEKSHFPYVSETLQLPAGKTYLSRIVINHERGAHAGLNQPTAQLAMPVMDARGKALGVIVISLDLRGTFATLSADLPAGFQLFLANKDGDFLIHPEPSQTFGFDVGRRILLQDEFPDARPVVDGKAGQIAIEARTGSHAVKPILVAFIKGEIDIASDERVFILGVAQQLEAVLLRVDTLGMAMLKFVGGFGLLGIFLALLLARLITRPINTMSVAVQNFPNRPTIFDFPVKRQDELGQLARSFIDMQNQITQQISQLQHNRQELEHRAHFDALTNLPNRVMLADRLRQAMLQSHRRNQLLAVAYIDLDGFKQINDAHGHGVGDEVLILLSQYFKEVLREGDTLARIGGDEFVAVLVDLEAPTHCEPVLARLLQVAAQPIKVGDAVLHVSASIGVTLYPQAGADADQLLRHADQAMYVAKNSGKNRYHYFDVTSAVAMQNQRETVQSIGHALQQNQFVLHYQPKVNMQTGAVVGVEALIRWQHPQRGLLAPGLFLPVIESHPISNAVCEWVVASALVQMSAWHAHGLDLPVSVNIGALQLQQDGFAARLAELLNVHPDVRPDRLQLEVLETSALEDMVRVSNAMKSCQALGVSFALDDFGTGYSSLTHLRRLPAATLKIDQSFVRDMLDDPDDLAIVQGVIGLAKSFRCSVIAEGVETAAHGEQLLQMGCEIAQGYGIARPMPAADLPAWVQRWLTAPVWTA